MSEKTKNLAALLLCGGAAAALAFLFPLSGDDWQWALECAFPIFNGRYLGNLLTMLLTQHTWLRPFFFGGTFAFIVFALSSLFETRLLFPAFFLALAPAAMFSQVYQWTSGFSVFVPPVALLLACILLIRAIPRARGIKKAAETLALCIFSFAGTLFVEHITILYLALSLFWLIFRTIRTKKSDFTAILSLVFAAAGAMIMFKNPAYSSGLASSHTLPTLSQILKNIPSNLLNIASSSLVNDNTALTLALCALCIRLISLTPPRRGAKFLTAAFALFAAFIAIRPFFPYAQSLFTSQLAEAAAAAVFFILFWTTALSRLRSPRRKLICAALLAAMSFTCLTLLTVDPTGSRCYFICYVMWIAAASVLWGEAEITYKQLAPAALSLLTAVYVCCLAVYGYSTLAVARRAQAAKNAHTRVEVQRIPFDKWLWQANPTSDYLQTIYKNYYGLPKSCELVIVD